MNARTWNGPQICRLLRRSLKPHGFVCDPDVRLCYAHSKAPMKTFRPLFALLIVSLTTAFGDLVSDPAAKAVGATEFQTLALYKRLVGSTWGYVFHGNTYDVSFGQGGTITVSPWPGATWRITSANSIAIKHPKLGEMAVRFSPEFKKWICKDWGGDEGRGILRNANATVTK